MNATPDMPVTWVEALNITAEQLGEWSALAPEGQPLLVYCLEQGHVSIADYFEWASEAFGLPILSSAFFADGGLDPAFLQSHQADEIWRPWCFPVAQWDQVLFIACVEPPADADLTQTRFVLADPRAMLEMWAQAAPVPPAMEAAPVEVEFDAPHGLTLNATKPFILNFDESNLMMDSVPEGPKAPAPLEHAPAPIEIVVDESELPPDLHGTVIGVMPDLSSEPHEDYAPPVHLDDEEPMGTTPYLSPPTQLHAIATPEVDDNTEAAAELSPVLNLSNDESATLSTVYMSLQRLYTHGAVVRFNEDHIANLYRWSPSLVPLDDGIKASINLGFPSFLRIVVKTGMPYHGYLVDSPAHREFFQALGLRELPGCVTAVPLMIKGKMWGVLLALGDDSLQSTETLASVTSISDQLVKALGTRWAA